MNKNSLHASAAVVNLTNCDQEPIHIPGSIQPHGFLLGVQLNSAGAFWVTVASQSAEIFLRLPIEDILNSELSGLIPVDLGLSLKGGLLSEGAGSDLARFIGAVTLPRDASDALNFQVIGYRVGEVYVLEFEETTRAVHQGELNSVVTNFVAALEQKRSLEELCHAMTVQVRELTGFDRVMLYQFDEDGHGNVLAEDRNDRLPSYLGLRFPASDIPRQARALYVLNRVRIIPNVEYTPSPLRVASSQRNEPPLDLSLSVLRSVSPVHRDYMRNMGTASSMSVSIVIDGKLWGLISGHHCTPLAVPYLVRSACDVLSRIMGAQIAASDKAADLAHAVRLKSVQSQLLTFMATGENYIEGLVRHPEDLCAVTGAQGAAVIVGERCVCLGATPPEADVLQLSGLLSKRLKEDLFVTHEFGEFYSISDAVRSKASGILAISLSQIHRMQILWFRPEVVESVMWAGEPEKSHQVVDGVLQIHPRNSFASWKQIVRGKSVSWSPVEIDSARDFRNAVLEVVLKRAEELADMASELAFTNKELEAFSYSVSHDLRAPFRHISGFAELLLKDQSQGLNEKGRHYLSTIAESAQFAGLLVDSLLNFSRITRTKLEMSPVEMETLAVDVWRDVVKEELKGRNVTFETNCLPTVQSDINLMRQVLRNLFSNAGKYSRVREHATVRFSAREVDQEIIFAVQDNGAGFDGRYAHKLFGAFQRLHRMEDFEGTGIGLANVRRIISRMGGRTWAEGQEDVGATFFFSLPLKFKV